MTKPILPRNNPRRRFLARLAGSLLAGSALNPVWAGKENQLTTKQLTLWEAIDALAQQIPFAKDKIESLLAATLTETDNLGNDVFRFYKSNPVALAEGVVISNIDLRVKRSGPHPGFLVLTLEGSCIALEAVRRHYNSLKITGTPRGRSPDEQTHYTANQPWGDLSFGFAERNPDCLASVAFHPRKPA